MVDIDTISHDLTMLLLKRQTDNKTAEDIVKSYHEIFDEVHEAERNYKNSHVRKAVVPKRNRVL